MTTSTKFSTVQVFHFKPLYTCRWPTSDIRQRFFSVTTVSFILFTCVRLWFATSDGNYIERSYESDTCVQKSCIIHCMLHIACQTSVAYMCTGPNTAYKISQSPEGTEWNISTIDKDDFCLCDLPLSYTTVLPLVLNFIHKHVSPSTEP